MSIYGMHYSEIWSFVPKKHPALLPSAYFGD
jgi:hypothetical protein